MPLTPEELTHLMVKMDELGHEMAVHGAALKVTDRRSRWARTAGTIGVIAGIIGGVVGAGAVIVGANARATADELAQSRKESQVAGCVQQNLTTQRTRAALVAGVSVLATPNPERSPAGQAAVDEFVRRYTTQVENALPYRDCSQGGIGSYYDHPPVDPAAVQTSSTTITRG